MFFCRNLAGEIGNEFQQRQEQRQVFPSHYLKNILRYICKLAYSNCCIVYFGIDFIVHLYVTYTLCHVNKA